MIKRLIKDLDFSVVVTTFCRPEMLEKTLISLVNQKKYTGRWEIIVVDNDVKRSGRSIFDSIFKKQKTIKFSYVPEKKRGPSYARNTGLRLATHKHLIFVDDDVVVGNTFLHDFSASANTFTQATLIGVKSIAFTKDGKNLTKSKTILKNNLWIIAESFYETNKPIELESKDFLYSCCLYANKSRLGSEKFDQNILGRKYGNLLIFAEDFELSTRLILKKHQLIFDPSIVVKHYVDESRLSLKNLCKRFYLTGLEHKLMDKKLSVFAKYQKYRYDLVKYLKQTELSLVTRQKSDWLELLKYLLFDLGYLTGLFVLKQESRKFSD